MGVDDPFPPRSGASAEEERAAWEELVESMGPASLLVVIESRMSPELRRRLSPEDVLQEALLHAWRDRARCEWRGVAAYRAWFLTVIDNRLRDAGKREGAARRDARREVSFEPRPGSEASRAEGELPELALTSTPLRRALVRERAEVMKAALAALPGELREVVRLRVFEERCTEDVARELGIGLSAAKHRFRKGAALYRERLQHEWATRSGAREGKA